MRFHERGRDLVCPGCRVDEVPLHCFHPDPDGRVYDLGSPFVGRGCPAHKLTTLDRLLWRLFRLYHHRTPDFPGQPWTRTATATEWADLPEAYTTAFAAIESETYLIAVELQKAKPDGKPKPETPLNYRGPK